VERHDGFRRQKVFSMQSPQGLEGTEPDHDMMKADFDESQLHDEDIYEVECAVNDQGKLFE